MTYCVGMLLDEGLVMAADTRTNAGVDNVGKFKKLFTWEKQGQAVFVLLTAGNLAVTQAVVSMLTFVASCTISACRASLAHAQSHRSGM